MWDVIEFAPEPFEKQKVIFTLHQPGFINLYSERAVIGRQDCVGRLLHESEEDALHGPKVHWTANIAVFKPAVGLGGDIRNHRVPICGQMVPISHALNCAIVPSI